MPDFLNEFFLIGLYLGGAIGYLIAEFIHLGKNRLAKRNGKAKNNESKKRETS